MEESIQSWRNSIRDDKDTFFFMIRPLGSDIPLGFIDISGILWSHGNGWLGIAIGDAENRGQGYGYDAICLMLDMMVDGSLSVAEQTRL